LQYYQKIDEVWEQESDVEDSSIIEAFWSEYDKSHLTAGTTMVVPAKFIGEYMI